MELTYFEAKNGTKMCKITTNRKENDYDIDGTRIRNCVNQEERIDLLLQVIARNFGISHTHVITIAQDIGKIAKRTIEKELNNLEKDELLESEKDGDSPNAPRYWSIKAPQSDFEKEAKKEAKDIVETLKKYLRLVDDDFRYSNQVQKDNVMADVFDIIYSYQPIIELISKDVKIKKEKKAFDELVKKAYDILEKHDKRDFIDGRPFLRRLLHLKASYAYQNMASYLDADN